jgi:hypothetical protein
VCNYYNKDIAGSQGKIISIDKIVDEDYNNLREKRDKR